MPGIEQADTVLQLIPLFGQQRDFILPLLKHPRILAPGQKPARPRNADGSHY